MDEKLRNILSYFTKNTPEENTTIGDMAMDSLDIAEMTCSIEDEYGISIPLELFSSINEQTTVGEIQEIIRKSS